MGRYKDNSSNNVRVYTKSTSCDDDKQAAHIAGNWCADRACKMHS